MGRPTLLFCTALLWPAWAEAGTLAITTLFGPDQKLNVNMTSLLSSELSFFPTIDNVVDLPKATSLNEACLGKPSCLSAILKGSGGDQLVAGSVTPVGEMVELQLVFYDGATSKIIRQNHWTLPLASEQLASQINGVVSELLTGKSAVQVGTSAVSATKPSEPIARFDVTDEDDLDFLQDPKPLDKTPESKPKTSSATDELDFLEETPAKKKAATKTPEPKTSPSNNDELDFLEDPVAKKEIVANPPKSEPKVSPSNNDELDFLEESTAKKEAATKAPEPKVSPSNNDELDFLEESTAKKEAATKAPEPKVSPSNDDELDFLEETDKKKEAATKAPEPKVSPSNNDELDLLEESTARKETVAKTPEPKSKVSPSNDDELDLLEEPSIKNEPPTQQSKAKIEPSLGKSKTPLEEPEEEAFDPDAITFGSAVGEIESLEDPTTSATTQEESKPSEPKLDLIEDQRHSTPVVENNASPKSILEVEEPVESSPSAETLRRGERIYEPTRVQIALRSGYSRYFQFDFLTTGIEFSVTGTGGLHIIAGVEAYAVHRTLPGDLPNTTQSMWNFIYPANLGVIYKAGKGVFKPYVGADAIMAAYYYDAEHHPKFAFGGRIRGGTDIMFIRNFGINVNIAAGFWSGKDWPIVHPEMKTIGFLPQISGGIVAAF